MIASPLVELDHVRKTFPMQGGDVHALRDVSLTVNAGDFVSIVGTSGSGKSTLLYVIGTLIRASAGGYRLAGRRIDQLSDAELAELRGREIGFVFQSFHLVPQLNVLNNVLLSARYLPHLHRRELRRRATELIDQVGLSQRLRHRPRELSNGEQQRVAIARALLTQPSLVLADEPTGNLDEQNREEIFQALSQLNQDGTTILLVTHDLQLAQRTPRTIRLRDGEVTP